MSTHASALRREYAAYDRSRSVRVIAGDQGPFGPLEPEEAFMVPPTCWSCRDEEGDCVDGLCVDCAKRRGRYHPEVAPPPRPLPDTW